jgi:prepilin-type N-terminal cleavage/methylation domain-containing protein
MAAVRALCRDAVGEMTGLLHSVRGGAAPIGRRFATVRREDGFSLIELTVAMVLFAIVALALVGLMQSAIAANGLARQKTVAQQMAQDEIESIRELDYWSEIGLVSGNPTGIVQASRTVAVRGVDASMLIDIDWVNDPTPASYSVYANYKKITVVVRSNRDNRVLASVVTFVAPPGRAPFGGLSNAVLNVTVQEMGPSNQPLEGALVSLASGPSAPLSDSSDVSGLVTFAALTANPTSGPTAFYDVTATKSGFITYVDDRVPLATAHRQLAPSQEDSTTIRLYRPATIDVVLQDSGGAPYTGPTTVKLTSQRTGTTQTYTASGSGSLSITAFAGEPVVPGDFTVRAFTSTGLCADAVQRYVPDDYPTDMSASYTLQLQSCPSGAITVNATQLGGPADGATVEVSGGPNDFAPIVQTANASGSTTFGTLPSGTDPYTITVTRLGETATTTAVVVTGSTTTVDITLPDPPVGDVTAVVRWLGAAVNGATVQITGGPDTVDQTLVTDASGQVTFPDLATGSGYTVTATKGGQSVTQSGVAVATGSTTTVTLDLPTAVLTVTATWAGVPIGTGSSNVTVTGGPDGSTYTGSTDASGVATITVPRTTAAYPYVVSVTKNGGSGTSTVTSVPAGGASTTVAFSQVGTITASSTWAAVYAGNATVTITGGPIGGTWTATTAAGTGFAPAVSVPATTAAYPYTVSITKTTAYGDGTGSVSVTSVPNGGNTDAAVALTPTKTLTLRIRLNSAPTYPAVGTLIQLSITGGPNGTPGSAPAYSFTQPVGASGWLPALTVPRGTTGSTYRVKAWLSGCPGVAAGQYRSRTQSNLSNTGTNSNHTITFNSGTCPLATP